MNSKLLCVCAFSLGAAVGAIASWRILKPTYEKISRDEIESIKAKYADEQTPAKSEEKNDSEDDEKEEYLKHALEYGGEAKENDADEKPYIISPEEFAEIREYDTTTYYYHSDGILVETTGEIVEDVEGTVGTEFSDHFGDYEEDSVFVRNDRLQTDFEILKVTDKYFNRGCPGIEEAED